MPIPYDKLTYNDILHNQAAYERFDSVGKELFTDWDIIGFEKAVLGCGDNHYLFMAEQIMKAPNLFGDLDKTMPFLRFGKKDSIMVMSCFFPLQRIGVAEVRLYGGLMQHAALLMTNYRWMSKLSLKNTKASLESLV